MGSWCGSQDVAHDCQRLKDLGMTHMFNVGYSIPDAVIMGCANTACVNCLCTVALCVCMLVVLTVGLHIPDCGNV